MNSDNKFTLNSLILYGSILSFFYFLVMLIIHYLKIDFVIVGVFVEILTIPFMLLLLFLTLYSIVEIFNRKMEIKSKNFVAFIILIVTVTMLSVATIFD